MHEYPVTERIVQIVADAAREQNAKRVVRISMVVGELSGFVGDSIQMYFDQISKGTIAEGAEMVIRYVKPQLKCTVCGKMFERQGYSFECPHCHTGEGFPSDIGKEFYVENIEIEE